MATSNRHHTAIAAVGFLVATWAPPVAANGTCDTDFQTLYGSGPGSTHDSAGCQTCHTSGLPGLNGYGIDVADCSVAAIQDAEDEDSDTSGGFPSVGGDNMTEILAGAQPGWCEPATPGCDNVETPPGSISGPLDPAPPEALLLLRNSATYRWQSFTLDGLTVTSGGEVDLPISTNIQPVGRADLDGDTSGDVLVRNEGGGSKAGQFQSYLLVGQTITDDAVLNTIEDLDYAVISNDDFGGDGKGDLLLRDSTGAWLMYEIDGVTALSFGVPALPTDTAFVPRATGDFNGDLRADVLMRRGNGVWELYLMDAQLSIDNGQPALPTLNVWEILAVEDYNGDGKDDLLMRRSDTGLWWIYLMDGTTVLDERQVIRDYKPLNFEFKSAEDFDGDGRADILIRNVNNGIWRLFLMDGTTIIDKGVVDLLRSSRFSFIDAQDLNNDGKADVIIRKDDGRWHATLMDGVNPKIDSDFIVLQKNLNWFLVID